ncbi:187-kDa microtubule-associated protein AIR9 [Camellia lanceoleosa]|uniref:187-kDa microtubule-associated protein AIR9 n=1 Tax=Camellia lanceoleosa TaxID=1840588 RepID=A0ACC0FQE0_9ERIC|nr:187-kDa microtubule-associated protein AIR9 [Camellia lanceoleosa]
MWSSVCPVTEAGAPESRDSRFMMLPHVEIKAGDDVRLDLRGHRIRSLNSSGLNLSPNLEFTKGVSSRAKDVVRDSKSPTLFGLGQTESGFELRARGIENFL